MHFYFSSSPTKYVIALRALALRAEFRRALRARGARRAFGGSVAIVCSTKRTVLQSFRRLPRRLSAMLNLCLSN